jgi:hypothetical protein
LASDRPGAAVAAPRQVNAVTVIAILLAGLTLTTRVSCEMNHTCGSRADLTWIQTRQIAESWWPRWQLQSDKVCPEKLDELARAVGALPDDVRDSWEQPLGFVCAPGLPGGKSFGVYSIGPDGESGTHDDLESWRRHSHQ